MREDGIDIKGLDGLEGWRVGIGWGVWDGLVEVVMGWRRLGWVRRVWEGLEGWDGLEGIRIG